MKEREHNSITWHLGVAFASRPRAADNMDEAGVSSSSVSVLSESDSEQASERTSELTSELPPGSSSGSQPSLLDKLRAPRKSELTRKRKLRKNPPSHPTYAKRRPSCSTDPKSVTPLSRAREFPDENLAVSAGKLFCTACREEISLKRSIVASHISSIKHKQSKVKLARKDKKERDIATALVAYDEQEHPRGETLPADQRVYRIKVVTAFLKAGVPLAKLDHFRDILEENAYRLSDRRGMSDLIPFILSEEIKCIRDEIDGKPVSIIFDGTSRLGEALVIVVRFIDDWEIKQRLIRMQILVKSMTGEELAREVLGVLCREYKLSTEQVLASMRDRASVNGVAIRHIKVMFPNLLDIGCYSHTLDIAGNKFELPTVEEFIKPWISLFSHSPKARFEWKSKTGRSMASYSETRWWSRWEVFHQVMQQFGDVRPFLQEQTELSPVTRSKLLHILADPLKNAHLQIELAAVIDAGEPIVKATYNLEGDGPLAFNCYEILSTLAAEIHVQHYPNLHAVAQKLSGGSSSLEQQLVDYGKACIAPGLQYFHSKFSITGELGESVAAFKAARLIWPQKMAEMQPNSQDIDAMQAFPFLKGTTLVNLKQELPAYLAKAADLDQDADPLHWWKKHSNDLPSWSAAAKNILLVQPSSAAAERVFSLLQNSFRSFQDASLADYIQASLMLQYNGR